MASSHDTQPPKVLFASVAAAAAVPRRPPSLQRALLRAIDMPARETLLIARSSLFATLAPALLGAALIAACSLAAVALGPPQAKLFLARFPRTDFLRAVFEALAVTVPSAIVLATYARLEISTRALLAAFALGLLNAGVVVLATLPLIAFLGLVAREQPMISPALLFPPIAVASIAATVARIVKAIDPSRRAYAAIVLVNIALFAVFAVRGLALI